MASRRTNLALLGLLAGAFLTGALAFAIGTIPDRWVVAAHGVLGLAIVALAPWKSMIARRGLGRERSGRGTSLVFSLLVTSALLFGVLHALGLRTLGPVTSMQLHVGFALVALPLAVWHVVARPTRPRRLDLSRRNLLRSGVLLGGTTLGYLGLEGLMRLLSLRGASRRFTGSHEVGSFHPAAMPVTQWLNDPVPRIDPGSWTVEVRTGGELRRLGYEQLAAHDDRVLATIDCTGGWYAHQDWAGVALSRIVPPTGASLLVRSATGYTRRFPMRDLEHLWLATRVGGEPLSAGHGFPARIVAPGRRGFWWVKWVVAIEVDETPWWVQSPFPLT